MEIFAQIKDKNLRVGQKSDLTQIVGRDDTEKSSIEIGVLTIPKQYANNVM